MQVFVRTLAGSVISVQVDATETMASVMERVWKSERIPVDQQLWLISCENLNTSACDPMELENGDLTPNFDFTYYENENEQDGEAAATNDSEFDEEEGEENVDRTWTFEEKKRAVDYYNETPGRTFKSVKRKWSSLSESQFSRFKKRVANGGTKWDKVRRVDAAVLATFTETKSKVLLVHDSDLAKWALETANKI